MPYSDTYLYSPLSHETVKLGEGKALLLQFILSEMCHCAHSDKKEDPLEFVFTSPASFFPFDWSYEVGSLNKACEHARLLPHAFENEDEAIDDFQTILGAIVDEVIDRKKTGVEMPHAELMRALSELFFKITPFLIACKESENLVLFLLKHTKEIEALSDRAQMQNLINEMIPSGDVKKIRNRFEKRGFKGQQSKFDVLNAQHARQ